MADSIPREEELIPNLHLLHGILNVATPRGLTHRVMRDLEQLPYYLRGACAAVDQLEKARLNAKEEYMKLRSQSHGSGRFVLNNEQFQMLSFPIDFCFTCLQRVLDALKTYLGRCPPQPNLPEYFSEVVKGIEQNRWNLDVQIQAFVTSYWTEVGAKITHYRNCGAHVVIVSSDCYLFGTNDGEIGLRMVLPHNPEDRNLSPLNLNYDPGVPALGFLLAALGATIRFVNAIVNRIVDIMAPLNQPAPRPIVHLFSSRGGPMILGPGQQLVGEPVPYPVGLTTIVSAATKPDFQVGHHRTIS